MHPKCVKLLWPSGSVLGRRPWSVDGSLSRITGESELDREAAGQYRGKRSWEVNRMTGAGEMPYPNGPRFPKGRASKGLKGGTMRRPATPDFYLDTTEITARLESPA